MRIVAAAVLYFVTVFAAGFLLGVVRTLLLEPRLGPFAAVLLEAPFLLAAIAFAARRVPEAANVAPHIPALLAVGGVALLFQLAADAAVGVWLRNIGLAEQLARFATPEGIIYAVLLAAFAVMPAVLRQARAA